jgi:rare lipoprotein A
MSFRLLAASAAALVLATASMSHAQPASAPEAAPAAIATPLPAAPAAARAKAGKGESSEGKVAYYGRKFAGRKTASGERFNPNAMTMAHKTLPFGTKVRVTNLRNNKSVVVRVNDRGPSSPALVGDLTQAAARKISMLRSGVVDARMEVVGMGAVHKSHAAKKAHKANKA